MKKLFLAVMAAALLLPASAQAKDYTVKMMSDGGKYRFEPRELAIKPGDQVTWINAQDEMHDIMTESVPENAQPFMSPALEKKGQTWSHVFTAPGAYHYHCHPHEALGMEGVILVGDGGAPPERKILYWYDPMVPGKKFDKPGKSPFMDMELMPKYAEEADMTAPGEKPVISVSAGNIQKMGVRTEKAGKSSFGQGIRATGIVLPNERARVDMFSQVEGRVGDLRYSAVGDRVSKGEVFFTLVSPELAALQNDYLAALSGGLKELAGASRQRMKRLGVDDPALDELEKTRKPFEAVPFHAPADGVLTELSIRNGHYLKAGDEIGRIQDLSVVWVEAAVPEAEAAAIEAGGAAKVLLTGAEQPYDAKVDYIYPTVNAEARTVKIRLVVGNRGGALKPSAYATVEFSAAVSERVTVPNEAVLRGSTGNHVIVSLGNGKFQARTVGTGIVSEGRTEILSGLKEGEEVVTSSQFMIDSESSLRESLNKMDTKETGHGKH